MLNPLDILSRLFSALSRLVGPLMGYLAGKRGQKAKQAEDRLERRKDAENAGAQEREDTKGLSDSDVVDRVRRRDGDWRGL